jgi:hypothetical protein
LAIVRQENVVISHLPRRASALLGVLSVVLGLASAVGAFAAQVTTTLPAVADTTLRQQQTNQNRGGDELVRLGWAQGSRALVRFDPAAIAAAVGTGQLVSAHLELWVDGTGESWGNAAQNVTAHRLTAEWTETGATWNCAIDSLPSDNKADCNPQWNGGAFLAAATATVPHTKETRGTVHFAVTADVAAFLAGTANRGWLLKKANEALSGRIDYVSREGAAAEHAPRLVLVVEAGGIDTTPPVLAITSPADGALVNTPQLQLTGTVTDNESLAEVTVNGVAATVVGNQFTAQVDLAEEANDLVVRAVDAAGNEGFAITAVFLDTQRPNLFLDAPASGQLTNQAVVRVAGLAEDGHGILRVEVNGAAIPVAEGKFDGDVALSEGLNQLTVQALDLAGNAQAVTVEVTRFSLPEVAITAPVDLSILAATTAEVRGTVTAGAAVSVNGVSAAVSGTSFTAVDVPLIEGGNIVTATATVPNGHVGIDTIHVVRDLTAPRVDIRYPEAGARVTAATITVSGLVNDIVPGTVNASEASVTVNGHPATVANRSFLVEGVPLVPGDNVLAAVARDESGNVAQATISVRFETGAPRIAIASGDLQEGTIGTQLPAPLVVTVFDAVGLPVAGRPVLFKIRGGTGTLDGGRREIAVVTAGDGRASVRFTLGSRAGTGNQAVEVSSVGFRGAVFRASAQPSIPSLIVVDAGDQQVGIAGQTLPRPLIAVVTDAGHNRLEGALVRFTVVLGQGRFENGLPEVLVATDSDGRAIVPFVLDAQEGIVNNVVEARIELLPEGPAAGFAATGRAAGDPARTAIKGVVLDNTNLPIEGVTLRVLDTPLTARTDDQGQFRIEGAPVGTVKLVVDGSTAERPGAWPDLEFVLTTVPGRDNTVGMPILLLPLDLQAGVFVDETRGGAITLPEIPGFSLEIPAGSVVFPGGSRSGLVSVTAVHSDKVPMVPNFGQQPRFIVTIQPAGARFDPPARLVLPNLEGLAPGEVTEMYSFDHDLGHFVSIGPATVSDDGMVIASDPGVGIVKAGWHCGGSPGGSGTPHNCKACEKCVNNSCVPKTLCSTDSKCAAGSACDGSGKCASGPALIPKICSQLNVTVGNRQSIPITSVGCAATACGAAKREDITQVTHSCDSIDLKGAQITETVSSDNGCGPVTVKTGPGCPVGAGNQVVAPCTDTHVLCGPPAAFPMGTCTQKHTQRIFVNGCMATERVITYTFTRTATSCTGSVN